MADAATNNPGPPEVPSDAGTAAPLGGDSQSAAYGAAAEEDPLAQSTDTTSDIAMDPDHPLLARAQAALAKQLKDTRTRLEEELREKKQGLKSAKAKREQVGVELYGAQQQLAKLQTGLEQTHDQYKVVHRTREEAEAALNKMKDDLEAQEAETTEKRGKVTTFQTELDKLAGTLKEIEAYNVQMKNEIAVTRRATYVAEEQVTTLEKEKKGQDLRIDNLQETLKTLHNQRAMFEAQIVAQRRETKAAMETLAEAESEMETIAFEKKQLLQQWNSCLNAMARRDEALNSTEEALRQQREQELSIENELEALKRGIRAEQKRNEQLTSVLKKVETEAETVGKAMNGLREKHDKLVEDFGKLKRSLEQTEEAQAAADQEAKELQEETKQVDVVTLKHAAGVKDVENEMLNKLSDQKTTKSTSNKTVAGIRDMDKSIMDESDNVISVQHELAKVEVDILNTEAHNARLDETLSTVDNEIRSKMETIEKYEIEIRRRNDQIEKRTKEVDRLNRQFEKLVANLEDENTGPLEATIANLSREITRKDTEGKELQRRWVGYQQELVKLVQNNNALLDNVRRLKSEYTVLGQKRARLDASCSTYTEDIKGIDKDMANMHKEMAALNNQISKNTELQQELANNNFNLETDIGGKLRELEEEAVRLDSRVEATKTEKRDVLAAIVETERQIHLWERKIQLEKEMQAALNPEEGNDVIKEMQKEIHRMRLRHTELLKRQEKLISDMETAIFKRETIATKSRAFATKLTTKKNAVDNTKAGLNKACNDLKRSIKETQREMTLFESNIGTLTESRVEAQRSVEDLTERVASLKEVERLAYEEAEGAGFSRTQCLLRTAKHQRMAKRYEDAMARHGTDADVDTSRVDGELDTLMSKREDVRDFVEATLKEMPELEQSFKRVLLHLSLDEDA